MQLTATTVDLATPKLRSILAELAPAQRRAMLGRLGKELERLLKAHFTTREGEGNQRGWPSQHFWAREVRAKTALRAYDADSATVGIDSAPFRHKLQGGTIRPGPGRKALAIPLSPEVAGVYPRAGTIDGLFLLKANGKPYLAVRTGRGFKQLRLLWRLVPSVTQAADPRALPPLAGLRTALEGMAERELDRLVGAEK